MSVEIEVRNIVESIHGLVDIEEESDVQDPDDFCTQIGDLVYRLNALCNDENTPMSRDVAIIRDAMEKDGISSLLDGDLADDINTDELGQYVDAFLQLREFAEDMSAQFPKIYPLPNNNSAMAY